MWSKLLGLPNVKLSFAPTVVEVAQSGELGYDQGTYDLSFDGPKGPVADRGKYVVVWKKEEGEWHAALDILNSDLPAPG
jgi:ketosteroid isomerase-like protein